MLTSFILISSAILLGLKLGMYLVGLAATIYFIRSVDKFVNKYVHSTVA